MITIHHSPLSRSTRVVWFCEETGIDYRLETVEMFSAAMKRPEYLAINPLGKVPTIEDDGFVLWETGAILQYLDAKYGHGQLIPAAHTREGALARQWMEYGENPLTVIMGEIVAHGGALPETRRIPALVDRGSDIAGELVDVVEAALEETSWILGDDFSAADIMLVFGMMIADHLGYVTDNTPRLRAYLDRAMARPAFQKAVAL
ncbi:glutathione S-transferase family protein [Pseudohalioglobus sediminis]|nr:glutathione S-transferase family protein [Pseudohalioglobus sediminis]